MLDLVAVRLASSAMPPLVSVSGAEDLAALAEGTAAPDLAAFVVPYSQAAGANLRMTGPVLQRVQVTFLVAICIRRYGDAKGSSRIGITDELDRVLEAALLGWTPSDGADPITLAAIRSQPAKNAVLWHVSTWTTARNAKEADA